MDAFTEWARDAEPHLREALTALFGVDDQLEAAGTLVTAFDLRDPIAPHEAISKSLHCVNASGLKGGDQKSATEDVQRTLAPQGWSVAFVEELDTEVSPTTVAIRVVATSGDLIASVALFDHIGVRPAPPDTLWLQLTVARSGDPFGWAP